MDAGTLNRLQGHMVELTTTAGTFRGIVESVSVVPATGAGHVELLVGEDLLMIAVQHIVVVRR